jgi:ribosomal protein S1
MENFNDLLQTQSLIMPQVGDVITGKIIACNKREVRLDIDGLITGIIRGKELKQGFINFNTVKVGDLQQAIVLELDNEDGEVELGLSLEPYLANNSSHGTADPEKIIVTVVDANRGGLLVRCNNADGFLPSSHLSHKHYPRVDSKDKESIVEKLKEFIGQKLTVQVLDMQDGKIIVSEKNIEDREYVKKLGEYKPGQIIEGTICATADFGVFVRFDGDAEGLIHISELAWQRIDHPGDIYKVGQKIKAEILNVDGAKIFLSSKKLMKDPWESIQAKYTINQIVKGTVIKINPFGLFVELEQNIQGLAHNSELPKQKITIGDVLDFKIININAKEHRLGLSAVLTAETETKTESAPATETTQSAQLEIA